MLSGALKSLFAVAEAYPDLKANQNFLNLQEELTATEDRVAYARQFYNDSVLSYNTQIQKFPTVILAGMFNFEKREFFDADPEDTETPAGPVLASRADRRRRSRRERRGDGAVPRQVDFRVRADRAQQAPHVPDAVRLRRPHRAGRRRRSCCSSAAAGSA